ncbi:MAG: hypothetical protein IJO96_09090 [Oscillospiraceae bacterium]|nr:hypothetical protein [Oscillospiraceae bacterium]
MVYNSAEMEQKAALEAATLMCAAARTAPKAKGLDNIVTLVLTGEDIVKLSDKIKEIGLREFGKEEGHFTRDAMNILKAQAVVMIGVKRVWYGLPYCSMCGFKNCDECKNANANCVFPPMDLGIAIGSAVSAAADLRIDNRIMFSLGKAMEEMDYIEDKNIIWQGIPLSISGKNVFFDRQPSLWQKQQ